MPDFKAKCNSIYAGALSQTPLGELIGLPRPLAVCKRPNGKERGMEWEKKRG